MKEIIFADNDNYREVAKQLRFDWYASILTQCQINLDNCFPESGKLEDHTIEQKIKLRKILSDNKILVIDNIDDFLSIYIQDQLIAQWNKPIFNKKIDYSQKNPKKKIYIAITIEYNSVFEEIENIKEGN